MDFSDFIRKLGKELAGPLPGPDSQLQMSSMRRVRELLTGLDRKDGVKSSVLILLYPSWQGDDIYFVLIQRPRYDGVHGGQISLPGGRAEEADASAEATALRESAEEIGSDPVKVKIVGSLSELYIPPSIYLVLPFVGFMYERPEFQVDPREVDGIIEVKISELMDDESILWKDIFVRPGITVYGPCFEINGNTIWGATAMILNEFKAILKRISELQ